MKAAPSSDPLHSIPALDPSRAQQEGEDMQISNWRLVLKRVILTTRQKDQGKLRPNWKGLYIIIARRGKGSYIVADQDGKMFKK